MYMGTIQFHLVGKLLLCGDPHLGSYICLLGRSDHPVGIYQRGLANVPADIVHRFAPTTCDDLLHMLGCLPHAARWARCAAALLPRCVRESTALLSSHAM